MNAEELLFDLARRGVAVAKDGDRLRYWAPKGVLTPALRDLLAAHKPAILARLGGRVLTTCPDVPDLPPATASPAAVAPENLPSRSASVRIGGEAFTYLTSWDGEILPGDRVAFDTETEAIRGHEVPALALASASSGAAHCLIHPDRVGAFILAHRDRHLVFQNVAFDFWVVVNHLEGRGEDEALRCWWAAADEGRMHDTMILDMLVRLARRDEYPRRRPLDVLGKEYAGLEISKDDPFRLRYGEIIGADWAGVEPGFFAYAIKDAVVTWRVHETLAADATALARAAGVDPLAVTRHGPLTEAVQVKGAIALARVTRLGMRLDLDRAAGLRRGYEAAMAGVVGRLRAMPEGAGLFKADRRTGGLALTATGAPRLSQKALRQALTGVAAAAAAGSGQAIELPKTPKGAVSVSTKDWADLAHLHPFVQGWIDLAETAKLCQFFAGLREPVVHPGYGVLVRSGRSCAGKPNVQQIPRKGGLREVFVPSPGHLLLAVDYSFIELRTLAAECEARYGGSTLADVIRRGVDPHCYTAALLLGMELGDFMALRGSDPDRFKRLRQNAKALNFGIPGGLGAAALVQYARATYGVEMTEGEARDFRDRLVNAVYPELGRYLAEDGMALLARNLGVTPEQCWARFDWKGERSPAVAGGVRNVVRGKVRKADGTPYSPRFVAGVWAGLAALNRNEELAAALRQRAAGEDLARRLFRSGVATLTGRLRGRVNFSQARNTPFQGLAADGAKLALWGLLRGGFRVVGFVHDEFLVELPDRGGYAALRDCEAVKTIVCEAMARVTGGVPVDAEYTVSRRWSKEAKLIVDGDRVLAWEPEAGA